MQRTGNQKSWGEEFRELVRDKSIRIPVIVGFGVAVFLGFAILFTESVLAYYVPAILGAMAVLMLVKGPRSIVRALAFVMFLLLAIIAALTINILV